LILPDERLQFPVDEIQILIDSRGVEDASLAVIERPVARLAVAYGYSAGHDSGLSLEQKCSVLLEETGRKSRGREPKVPTSSTLETPRSTGWHRSPHVDRRAGGLAI
jgi:hypothetical protein